jgi:pyruvate/2-oxoglutarate dehydrogenase complex dihydrolipoamide dehydrogenase (E3) component
MARKSAFVIGLGVAGIEAARTLARAGIEVRAAEPGPVGGTCVWAGCIPKKALWVSAQLRQAANDGARLGVDGSVAPTIWPNALAWERQAEQTYAGDQEALLEKDGIEHIDAPARFVSPDAVTAGGATFEPDAIVICTGSQTVMPPLPGIELCDTSSAALVYPEVPASLVIVGGGYIGMEFAAAYAPFGTKILVIEHAPQMLPTFDAEAVAVAVGRLHDLGVKTVTGARASAIEGKPGELTVRYAEGDGRERTAAAERVLVAVGRRPNVERLDLAAGGVDVDERGRIVMDVAQRTSNPKVWVAGDAAGTLMICPAGYYAGETVARSIAGGTPVSTDYSAIPSTAFSDPPVSSVGLTEAAARVAGIDYEVRRSTFEFLGAGIVTGRREGLVKLLFAKDDGRLVGGHVAGPTADDLVYPLALAIRTRNTAADLAACVGIHPGYCEAIYFAAWSEPE